MSGRYGVAKSVKLDGFWHTNPEYVKDGELIILTTTVTIGKNIERELEHTTDYGGEIIARLMLDDERIILRRHEISIVGISNATRNDEEIQIFIGGKRTRTKCDRWIQKHTLGEERAIQLV